MNTELVVVSRFSSGKLRHFVLRVKSQAGVWAGKVALEGSILAQAGAVDEAVEIINNLKG